MTDNAILEYIFNRLAKTGEAMFSKDETQEWPTNIINILLQQEMIRKAQPAKIVECNGCEQNCIMPVHVFPTENSRPARAFIACDKREDIGRVPVDISRLEQWQITDELIAKKIARLLEFLPPPQKTDKYWLLGNLKGRKNNSSVKLSFDGGAFLEVSEQKILLLEILQFDSNNLIFKKNTLLKIIDKQPKKSSSKECSPTTTQRNLRKSKTQNQYKDWQKVYREIREKNPGMSNVWYSKQIAKMDIANGKDEETIRKHMIR